MSKPKTLLRLEHVKQNNKIREGTILEFIFHHDFSSSNNILARTLFWIACELSTNIHENVRVISSGLVRLIRLCFLWMTVLSENLKRQEHAMVRFLKSC